MHIYEMQGIYKGAHSWFLQDWSDDDDEEDHLPRIVSAARCSSREGNAAKLAELKEAAGNLTVKRCCKCLRCRLGVQTSNSHSASDMYAPSCSQDKEANAAAQGA